jgi:DNA-binding Xre family transcriptional regulator
MAISFEVNLDKLRRATWGHGEQLSQVLGITKMSLSRKLNQKQPILIAEINAIVRHLDLDARDFVFFVDEQKKVEIRSVA